jgi:hypothetical protein
MFPQGEIVLVKFGGGKREKPFVRRFRRWTQILKNIIQIYLTKMVINTNALNNDTCCAPFYPLPSAGEGRVRGIPPRDVTIFNSFALVIGEICAA